MGQAVLAHCPEIEEIRLVLPNRHHLLVDLTPFGLDNPNEIFMVTEEPYGRIEAVVGRSG
jgi:urate oxidase